MFVYYPKIIVGVLWKQRVYEILYRELVENYANSKGRTNTADFWLTIECHILCIWFNYMHYGPLQAIYRMDIFMLYP